MGVRVPTPHFPGFSHTKDNDNGKANHLSEVL
jgi:hypothetical protein